MARPAPPPHLGRWAALPATSEPIDEVHNRRVHAAQTASLPPATLAHQSAASSQGIEAHTRPALCRSPKAKEARLNERGRAPASALAMVRNASDPTGCGGDDDCDAYGEGADHNSSERGDAEHKGRHCYSSTACHDGGGRDSRGTSGVVRGSSTNDETEREGSGTGAAAGHGAPSPALSDGSNESPSVTLRRVAWEEVMAVLGIYVRGKYSGAIADRMLALLQPKIRAKIDTLSDAQVAILRERAREKQEGSQQAGVEDMFQRMVGT